MSSLDPARIVATAARLKDRIAERFPGAHLREVATELHEIASQAARRSANIVRPNVPLRLAIGVLIASIPLSLAYTVWSLHLKVKLDTWSEFVGLFQTGVESLFFLGVGILFLVTLESRGRRKRALDAIHELSVLAHLVDMHQLDKDPVYLLNTDAHATKSSPTRAMTAFELNRYLDYCSEMLSVLGKIAATYAQGLHDPGALSAVNDVEALATGMSRKIWQKIMLIERAATKD